MWNGDLEKTTSTRIPEEAFDRLEERLEDYDLDKSDLMRVGLFPAGIEDDESAHQYLEFIESAYDDFESWDDLVNQYLDENPEVVDTFIQQYATNSDIDRDEVEDGVKDILLGLRHRDRKKAYQGGQKLGEIDRGIEHTAAFYLSEFPEDYWALD
ncbi:MAG: hypothetical protein ABEI58_02775 [Candidatus Nanohaloarchaea archaeon]